MPCIYKQECTELVTNDYFIEMCQSDTQKYIYCEEFKRIQNPMKLPKDWDEK